jgi:hypothetical protein
MASAAMTPNQIRLAKLVDCDRERRHLIALINDFFRRQRKKLVKVVDYAGDGVIALLGTAPTKDWPSREMKRRGLSFFRASLFPCFDPGYKFFGEAVEKNGQAGVVDFHRRG